MLKIKDKSFNEWGIIISLSIMSICLIIEVILDIIS